ncbi:helix-turn-helix transcriptional regulator [Acidovorax sp. Leaf78]|uniref:helix-turn-helix domain-containing protein n=1 Tax=Acidovorax sp. Leaf78 TaxID=1736237 RepID=UPI00138F4545
MQNSTTIPRCFGELLYDLRQRSCLSQKQLAKLAKLPASSISEIENTRRAPPPLAKVRAIGQALQLPQNEQRRLAEFAQAERVALGLRVSKGTPTHVASLLRDIAALGGQLSPAQVSIIQKNLESIMK